MKVATIGGGSEGQDIEVGFELLYRKYARVFEQKIERWEERTVLAMIKRISGSGELSKEEILERTEEIRKRALDFLDYKVQRKRIPDVLAKTYRQFVNDRENTGDTIMYFVFELSDLDTLRTFFAPSPNKEADRTGQVPPTVGNS